jgi:hypothetical protein
MEMILRDYTIHSRVINKHYLEYESGNTVCISSISCLMQTLTKILDILTRSRLRSSQL